jgi:hypothetical protein
MFSCVCPRPVPAQKSRRGRRLPAALLAAALLLASGAAQAAPGRGQAPGKPAGLLESVHTWLLWLVGLQDDTPDRSAPAPTDLSREGLQTFSAGATYDPATDAGGRMDPNG